MTAIIKKATKNMIQAILTQVSLSQRLIEIAQEVQNKMENGMPAPHRLEMEFAQLSHEMNKSISRQAEAEQALGLNKNFKFFLN